MGRQGGAWRVPKPCCAICLYVQRATLQPLSDPSLVKSDYVFLVSV